MPSAESRLTLVTRGGERIAAINHAASTNSDRLDRALGPAMRLALQNDQLRAATLAELRELQLSRTRILERAALERRRLERNLHDEHSSGWCPLRCYCACCDRRSRHHQPQSWRLVLEI